MRRFLSILFLGALSLGVRAQEGIPLLDKVEGHRVTFHYTYSLSQKGGDFAQVTDGDVTLEGNCYKLQGLGMEVISDGTTRWTLDREAKEALVEPVEKEDLFTNPALFVASYKSHMDQLTVNGQGKDWLDVTLKLDDDNSARFLLKDIVFMPLKGKSDFSVEEKSLPDFLITDLR